jgi:hypothetical protein
LTESSLFLLGSTCPEYHVKGTSVHLHCDFGKLEADPPFIPAPAVNETEEENDSYMELNIFRSFG